MTIPTSFKAPGKSRPAQMCIASFRDRDNKQHRYSCHFAALQAENAFFNTEDLKRLVVCDRRFNSRHDVDLLTPVDVKAFASFMRCLSGGKPVLACKGLLGQIKVTENLEQDN